MSSPGEHETGPEPGEQIEVTVERLAYGGEGVARADGLVVFVPWTAPGDVVRATVTERQPSYARAKPEEVVSEGPARVEPGCPVFGTCGGCQIQHLSPDAQRDSKARAVADAFERIARLPLEEVPRCEAIANPWHYRHRAVFSWRRRDGGLAIGFHQADDPDAIVEIHACPIFSAAGNLALQGLAAGLANGLGSLVRASGAPLPPAAGRLAVRTLPGGEVQAGLFAPDPDAARELAGACAAAAGVPTTWGTWSEERAGLELAPDAPRLEVDFEYRGWKLRAGFDSFLQVDLEAANAVYDAVLEDLKVEPGERVMDGYAGIGVITCELLAREARVTAVEAHPGAASDLQANVSRVGEAHVLQLPVDRVDWVRPEPDAVVLNPPRSGIPRAALGSIDRSSARRIVYVSCDPTTLARDVRRLGPRWRVTDVRPFDLFPQTAHVETLTRLERAGGG